MTVLYELHSVTVLPLTVVVHAPETVLKDESEESMVMVEPSLRMEVLSVISMTEPLSVVVVVVHSVTDDPSMKLTHVEDGVVLLNDESLELMVTIDPLRVVVLSVTVLVENELSMVTVVHASKVEPEMVVVKTEEGDELEKLGLLDDIVKVSPDMVKVLSVTVVVVMMLLSEHEGTEEVSVHSMKVLVPIVVVQAPVVELKDDELDEMVETAPVESVDVL